MKRVSITSSQQELLDALDYWATRRADTRTGVDKITYTRLYKTYVVKGMTDPGMVLRVWRRHLEDQERAAKNTSHNLRRLNVSKG